MEEKKAMPVWWRVVVGLIWGAALIIAFFPMIIYKLFSSDDPIVQHLKGKYDQAEKEYLKLIEKDKSDESGKPPEYMAVIYFDLGLLYKYLKRDSDAAIYFMFAKEKGCELNPDDYSGKTPVLPPSR